MDETVPAHVWVVSSLDWEESEIVAVLSSEAAAIAVARQECGRWGNLVIEKHRLDVTGGQEGSDLVEWRVPSLDPPERATFMGSCGYP